ncbi:MAG: hypothetical protein JNM27_20775 [Leptospirales bacterium]|nr:hypothetical protein [Leptospirales bacterium]
MESQQTLHRISGKNSQKLHQVDDLTLWLLGSNDIEEFNLFISKVYNEAFSEAAGSVISASELATQTAEYFPHTRMCGVRHVDGTLLGTWGLITKDTHIKEASFLLPIESRYGISVSEIQRRMNSSARFVFNGWRTAVDKEALEKYGIARTKSFFIFDYLLKGLTVDFSGNAEDYLGVAEMELLVLKYHRRVGIPWHVIGDPLFFWGRDRFPCAFRMSEFKDYMREHHPERFKFIYES